MTELRLPTRLLLLAMLLLAAAAPAATAAASPAAACTQPYCVYLSALYTSPATSPTQDRQASRTLYLAEYLNSENAVPLWTGDRSTCNPGTTAADFRAAIVRRINYFRAMAGVPGIRGLSDAYNAQAQAAALMMSVNRQLNHTPPSTWTCYSAGGAAAAAKANLSLGEFGPAAITGYMMDAGANNSAAGHRRWLLFPPTQQMGAGDLPASGGYPASNALWVFDAFDPRPSTRDPYVAWPPSGYVPYEVVFGRWSFSYPGADFTSATVTMRSGGAAIALTQEPVANGYGDNTLVWAPAGSLNDTWPRPNQDTTYTVTVNNVRINGQARSLTYDVVVFDPGA